MYIFWIELNEILSYDHWSQDDIRPFSWIQSSCQQQWTNCILTVGYTQTHTHIIMFNFKSWGQCTILFNALQLTGIGESEF